MPHRRLRSSLRACALACAVSAIASGCRVDVAVDVEVDVDGSGSVSVTVTADAEVVAATGDLAEDLRVGDLTAAGWEVTPPAATSSGGLEVVLRRDVADVAELTAVLESLDGDGGPLREVAVAREVSGSTARFAVRGTAQVQGGLAAFGDPDLLAAIGATPYADDLDARALTPTDALGITLRVDLPGAIERTGGTVASDGSVRWQIPVDGSSVDLGVVASAAAAREGGWSIAASTLRALFIGWVTLSAGAIVVLPLARRRSVRRGGRPSPSARVDAAPGRTDDDPEGDRVDGPDGPDGEPPRRPTFPLPNR